MNYRLVQRLTVSRVLLALVVCGICCPSVYAQTTRTWVGGTVGLESDMATATNWSPSAVPSTSANDPLLFNGSSAFNTLTFPGGTFSGNLGLGDITIASGQTLALSINNSGTAGSVFRLKNVAASPANFTIQTGAGPFSMGTSGNALLLTLTNASSGPGNIFTNDSANLATFGTNVSWGASSGINGQPTFAGTGDWLIQGPITSAIDNGVTKNGNGTLTLSSASNAYTGGTNITAGKVIGLGTGTTTVLGAGAVAIGGILQLNNTTSGTAFQTANTITGAGTIEFESASAGAPTFSTYRTQVTGNISGFTGDFHVLSGGNFTAWNAGATAPIATTDQAVTIESNGLLTFITTGSTPTTSFGALNGTGNVTTNSGSGSGILSIGNGGANGVFGGAITPVNTGTLALTKTGAGTQSLSGASTYTGLTTVSAGTLLANNSTGSATGTGAGGVTAAVTVASTGTLGGTGIINPTGVAAANAVSINGTLAPGDSLAAANATTGNLAIGGRLDFLTGSTFQVQLGGTSIGDGVGTYDQVNQTEAGGTITLAGTVNLSASLINSFTPSPSDVFYILNTNNTRTGVLFNGIAEGGLISLGGGYTGQVTYLANYNFTTPANSTLAGGNDVAIFNIVPEPSSLAMMLFGGMLLWIVRGKRIGS